MAQKVCILPSSELTTVFGAIGRQAAYRVCSALRPQKVVLGCMPALYCGVKEDLDFITDYPVITLEGHHTHTAAKLLKQYPRETAVIEIDIARLLKKNRISVSDSTPQKLGPRGKAAVRFLSQYLIAIIIRDRA